MRCVLTAGLLVLLLSGWVGSAVGQTPGPGPGEVPTELWREYPLEEPPAAAREGSAKRQSPERPAAGIPARDADDGGQGTSFLMIAGLLLLAIVAIVLATARRAGVERLRRTDATPRSATSDPDATREAAPVETPRGATASPSLQPAGAASARSRNPSAPPIRFRRARTGEPPPARGLTEAGPELWSPAPPRPQPTPAFIEPRPARGDELPAQARLSRQAALGYASAPAGGDAKESVRRQAREIEAACARKGLALLKFVHDSEAGTGSDLSRPGLAYALEHLAAHDASCLVVASVERLTRSAANLGTLVDWLDRCGARLVVVDIDLDTDTAEGRLDASALLALGESDRTTLEQRTGAGLEAPARPEKEKPSAPPASDEPALKRRIAAMRASGMTLQGIADTLNAEGVPTLRGGIRWRPSSVQAAAGYKRPTRRKSRFGSGSG